MEGRLETIDSLWDVLNKVCMIGRSAFQIDACKYIISMPFLMMAETSYLYKEFKEIKPLHFENLFCGSFQIITSVNQIIMPGVFS